MEDLLGSILNKMTKPPSLDEQQRKATRKQAEKLIERQNEERALLRNFQKKMQTKVADFMLDNALEKITLPPMNKIQRSIIHEIAETAGLSAFSFGEEDVDRHVVVYKKEFTPCQEELSAYRRGLEWKPKLAEEENEECKPEVDQLPSSKSESAAVAHYSAKYDRLFGSEQVKEATKVTQVNRKYGFVSSENKKDQRSIEQTLDDIRAKKRQKKDVTNSV
ncbi:sperm-associated antigen 7 homolog [Daphnia carinata]|uniref:sperm-associated antigen 7 homolog n=1 Tax=Daphnia carinata TaxID=120202 RepID=UPI00257E80D9|nr:sperm-associated antigen 7 homolog [Daphnia carinata]